MNVLVRGCVAGALVLFASAAALAQASKSTPLAKQLAAAMDAGKIDSVAAKDPANPGVYIGALYIPNFQLLVIANNYSAPVLLDTRIEKKEYRDVYIDLNSATSPATRFFVEDLGADGVTARREDSQGSDAVENKGTRTIFDGDWRKQKMSEEEYMKAFAVADERYAEVLTALLAQLKTGS
jgi:hypothetical protein